jgi:diguanylate cyclase (GGDEF)-like protein
MSLFRQLWLAVITSTVIAFAGSFLVSMLTARHYLEHQLAVKNNDNAASLALSMSQMAKDPVTLELQIAAIADSGQYASVRLLDPEGKTITEKASPADTSEVPGWFIRLFPISSPPGQAQVSTGWTQFGTIELISHNRFAYQELWDGGVKLLLWFLIGGFLIGLLGTRLLLVIKRPLDAVVEQALAISHRRLHSIPEPSIPELKAVANAMNSMVQRLKAIFSEEAAYIERIHREATRDQLTGIANRAFFLSQLEAALCMKELPTLGTLLILRVANLIDINKQFGREVADEILLNIGLHLRELNSEHPQALAGRLNGTDFALLLPGMDVVTSQVSQLFSMLNKKYATKHINNNCIAYVASSLYTHGQKITDLLTQVDAALANAENKSGKFPWCHVQDEQNQSIKSMTQWRALIKSAIKNNRIRLAEYPVVGKKGELLHLECPLRIQNEEDNEWITAGSVIPIASRLQLINDLDIGTINLAIKQLRTKEEAIAINITFSSLYSEKFLNILEDFIEKTPKLAHKLWIEISENEIQNTLDLPLPKQLSKIKKSGCHIGIKHFGQTQLILNRLIPWGVDYIKINSYFTNKIHINTPNQEFISELCKTAHKLGLITIAEGVKNSEEDECLYSLGIDGTTGPAVH